MIPDFYAATSSLLVIAPRSQWAALTAELVERSHPTDRWVPEKLEALPTIAQTQEACAFLSLTSQAEQGRVVVLPQADRLLKEAANALLKTLEEPPANARLILLAEQDRVLPTIRSRVQIWRVAVTSSTQWQAVVDSYDLASSSERELLHATLQLAPSVHGGVRNDTLDLLRRP
jgi:16S rRNA G1207 methylase RsmC